MGDRLSRVPGLVCPAIVAHRGASLRYPENTLAAFEAAIRAGADMIELDVRLTADGVPVVIHDPEVTTTDGSGLVHELTLAEIRLLHTGTDQAQRGNVPTLRQALTFLRGRAAVEIDLKNDPGEPGFDETHSVAAEALKLVQDLELSSAVMASANPETVEWVRRHAPDAITGIEAEESENLWEWIDYAAARGHTFLMPDAQTVLNAGRDFVARAHARGVQIDVWTVDEPRTVAELFAWGVDTVETNDPDMAVPIRDKARSSQANAATNEGRVQDPV